VHLTLALLNLDGPLDLEVGRPVPVVLGRYFDEPDDVRVEFG
jgi:hypothetical protein